MDTHHINAVAQAYAKGTPEQVRKMIVAWVANLNQWVENEVKIEHSCLLVLNLGHT